MTRRSRRLCPATPDAYFNWIPASLHCSSFPPKAEMTNSSGENDGCFYFAVLLFRHSYKNPPARHPRRQAGIQLWICRHA